MADKSPLDEELSSGTFSLRSGADQTDRASRQCRVLVVEDDQADYDMIVRHLKTTNGVEFQPTRAILLADGLARLGKGEMHVVLLDLDLPDSQGLETLRKLRYHAPRVPVVVLADVNDESLAADAAREGAQDYLIKGELQGGLLVRSIRYCVSRNKNRAKLTRTVQLARAAAANLRNIITSNVDGMIVVDSKGAIQFSNPAAEALLGRSENGPGGDPDDRLLSEFLELPAGIDVVVKTGKAVETVIVRSDGGRVPVEVRVVEMSWLREPARLVMLRDLTQRKHAEEELRESEERFKVTFENATDGILFADAETKEFYTGNQKICQMLACSLDELKNLGVSDIHAKEDLPYVIDQFEKQRRKEITLAKDIPVKRRDGSVFYADINSAPVALGGKNYLMGVVRDITERKRVEEELRKDRERLEELVEERTAELMKTNKELRHEITKRKEADEALRRSEARLQSLIRNVRTAVVVHLSDTSIAMANAIACDLLGIPEQQLLGKTADDPEWRFLREDSSDMPLDEYPVNRVLATRQPVQDCVVGVPRSDARGTLWGLVNAAPEFTADGDLAHVIVSFMDITDRKRAERVIKALRRFLEIANRHTQIDPLLNEFVAEVKSLTGCDSVGIRMLDDEGNLPYEASDGFSQKFYELESPLSTKKDQCMCINVVRGDTDDELPFYTAGGSFYTNGTTRLLATITEAEKGRTRNVCNEFGYESVALVPIRLDNCILGLIHVADRKENMVPLEMVEILEKAAMQAGTAVRRVRTEEQTHLLSSAVEQSAEGIAVSDVEGNLMFLNDAIAAMHGYRQEELVGKHLSVFHAPDQMPSVEAANRQLRETGEFSGEIWHARRDGTVFLALMRNSLLRDAAGNPVGLIGTLRDITERKRAEEELKASLRDKEILLKEIHHRVKNNMQVISSLLNLQSRQLEDDQAREIFQDMRSRVASMAMVHEQLYQSSDLARVDFAKHVRSLAAYLLRSYGDASGSVSFEEDIADVDLMLDMAIPCGLIINELVSNALKHAFPDGRKGEIRVGLRFADDRVTLVVVDNGVGFPAEMDFRAANTMGLRVVTTLVGQLDGTIEVDREGGTTFKITFPKSD